MHVLVNAAMSADGKLSSHRREQVAISGEEDFTRVDRLRAESDAILVGIGTVLADDPSLVRHDRQRRRSVHGADADPPARVVVDSRCRTPPDAAILDDDPTTYVLTTEAAPDAQQAAIETAGGTVILAGTERVDLTDALAALEAHGVSRLMVEGGGEIIFSLVEAGLVDSLSVYIGSLVIGGRNAPTLADGDGFVSEFPRFELTDVSRLDDGVLLEWRTKPDAENTANRISDESD